MLVVHSLSFYVLPLLLALTAHAVEITFDHSWTRVASIQNHTVAELCGEVSGSLICVTRDGARRDNVYRSLDAGASWSMIGQHAHNTDSAAFSFVKSTFVLSGGVFGITYSQKVSVSSDGGLCPYALYCPR
jgi:hypothetical protein